MKKIIFLAIAALAAAGFAGCTNSDEVGYDIEPKVLLPNSGLQKIILTASATDADCEVWIYRSGYRDGVSTASLHVDTEALDAYNQIFGTAYIAMPEEYYELPDAPVRLGNDGARTRWKFGWTCRRSVPAASMYCRFRSIVRIRRSANPVPPCCSFRYVP